MSSADDEIRDGVEDSASTAGETAVASEGGATGGEDAYTMSLGVVIDDVGPCRKHVQIKVPEADIQHFRSEAVGELIATADVPGFRKGKVPKPLIEKRFREELNGQLKQQILLQSLEQVAEEYELDPINEPDIDVEALDIPDQGDFEYEFDVEVRPEFDLPDYEGLEIKRPFGEISDEDVDRYLERFLSQYGQLVPVESAATPGDHVTLSAEFKHDGAHLHSIHEVTVRLRPVLRFQDAELEGFDELIAGASAGDKRTAEISISEESELLEMRGETIAAEFEIHEVKQLELPEMNKAFLDRIGVESEEKMREEVRNILERQVTYEQRQATRTQVLEKIVESADWDLPEDMVLRQAENARRREILEMQQAGFTTQDIRARENEIRQRSVSNTRTALKEHFVLDKIATKEGVEVTGEDMEYEMLLMAAQSGESPRRLRARLTKSGMIENLEAQIRERKAVDLILSKATFEDVPMEPPVETRVEAVSQSVCGMATESAIDDEGEEGDDD